MKNDVKLDPKLVNIIGPTRGGWTVWIPVAILAAFIAVVVVLLTGCTAIGYFPTDVTPTTETHYHFYLDIGADSTAVDSVWIDSLPAPDNRLPPTQGPPLGHWRILWDGNGRP